MAVIKIKARDYSVRDDIEKAIIALTGNDTTPKTTHIISGKREELAVLGLDETSTIWGVKCEVTDGARELKTKNEADRGVQFESGLNKITSNNE